MAPISKITSSSSINHQISILDDDEEDNDNANNNIPSFKIDIVLNLHYKTSYQGIITHQKTKSFVFALPLLLDNPQLIDSDNIYEVLWDQAMEELDDLDVDHHLRPRIIKGIASAYLRSTNIEDYDRNTQIAVDEEIVQEDNNPNKDVVKSLLISGGMTLVPNGGSEAATSCAICLDEVVSCDRGDDEEELLAVGKLSCNHVYHVECLVKWVINCGTNASATSTPCPLCRLPLFAATSKQS